MKSSVTKFDLEAAFKALDDINYAESDKGLVARRKNLAESIKCSQGKLVTESLLEDYYDLEDTEDLDKAADERANEVAQAKLARIEKIVDLDAKTADELLPSYVGKVIVQCPQCMTLFYKNEEDIEKDPDDPTNCNVNEPCQHCGNISGYTLIGKVDAVDEPAEEPVEEEAETEDSDLDLNSEDTEESEDTEVDDEDNSEEDVAEEDQEDSSESDEAEDDLDLNLESLNNSKFQKECAKKSNLDTDNHSTNLSLNEAADFSEDEEEPEITMVESGDDSAYYEDFLKNACYFINADGFFDVEGSDVDKKVDDIIHIFDEEIKDKSYGRATKAGITSADLEITDLQNGGKRIKIKGLKLSEALLTEETLEVATDKAIDELKAIQDSVEDNLDIRSTEENLHESGIDTFKSAIDQGRKVDVGTSHTNPFDVASEPDMNMSVNYSAYKNGHSYCLEMTVIDQAGKTVNKLLNNYSTIDSLMNAIEKIDWRSGECKVDLTENYLNESGIVSATDDAVAKLKAIQVGIDSDLGVDTKENLHESVSSVLAAFEASLDDESSAPVDESLTEDNDLKNLKADRAAFKKMINSKVFKDFSEDLNDDKLDEAIAITINVDEIEDEVVASEPCDTMVVSDQENTEVYDKNDVVSAEVEAPIADAVAATVEPEVAEHEEEESSDLDEGVLGTLANGAKNLANKVKTHFSDQQAKDFLTKLDKTEVLKYTITDGYGSSTERNSFANALNLVKELSKDQKLKGKPIVIGVENKQTHRKFDSLVSYQDGKVLNNHLPSVAALINEAEPEKDKNPQNNDPKDDNPVDPVDQNLDNKKAKVQKVKQKLPEITQETVDKVKDALGTLSQADTQKLLKLLNRSKTGRDMINNMSQDKAIFAGVTIDTSKNSSTTIESFIKDNYDVLAEALCEMGKIDLPTKLDSIEECDEKSINSCITEALQKVYTNVSSFHMSDCSLNNNKLVLEGVITFKSGKTRHTSYQFNEAKRNAGKLHLHGLNEAFGRDSQFDLTCSIDNKNLIVEKLSYNYKAANTIVEGLVEYNK